MQFCYIQLSYNKVRIEEKKKIDLTRRIKIRLYPAEKSQMIREVFKFVVTKFIKSKTFSHECKMIVSKKEKSSQI